VKLHSRAKELDKDQINSNNFIFFNDGTNVQVYSLYGGGNEGADKVVSPTWRLFVTEGYGKLEDDGSISVSYFKGNGKQVEAQVATGALVGQLRYEYALNLIQKLGSNFTRVGLDFAVA